MNKFVIILSVIITFSCSSKDTVSNNIDEIDLSSHPAFYEEVRLQVTANQLGDTVYYFQAFGMASCAACYEPTWNNKKAFKDKDYALAYMKAYRKERQKRKLATSQKVMRPIKIIE